MINMSIIPRVFKVDAIPIPSSLEKQLNIEKKIHSKLNSIISSQSYLIYS